MTAEQPSEVARVAAVKSTSERMSIQVLEPIERISEILFGLIMVLTFTRSLNATESGAAEVRTMLIGALGCNLAWGFIDALMYVMARLAERTAEQRTLAVVQRAATDEEAEDAIAGVLPSVLAALLTHDDLRRIRSELAEKPEMRVRAEFRRQDWLGALAVFLLVFVFTLPVVLPFAIFDEAATALRVSNIVAVAMMAGTGYAFGRAIGYRPWAVTAAMVLLGSLLVALTIALGG